MPNGICFMIYVFFQRESTYFFSGKSIGYYKSKKEEDL